VKEYCYTSSLLADRQALAREVDEVLEASANNMGFYFKNACTC